MTIPVLKRVRISSEGGLRNWLTNHPDQEESVMLVTCAKASHSKYVSREEVGDALDAHGWVAGPRYTLNKTLLGHVISKADVQSG